MVSNFKRIIILTALPALILGGCAVMNFYGKMDKSITAGDYAGADAIIEKEKNQYKGEHELLYYLDKGSVLQMLGDYKGSIDNLNKAELKIESLYTKSVTKELSSFFSNDLNLPYEGEDFEKVMVHIMKALGFMYMGDFNGAQIEARKVNHVMNVLSDRFEGNNKYKEDAFARYLSGFAYEAKRDYNDAYIDYKRALKTYVDYNKMYGTPVPETVKQDMLRMADALKFNDDIEEFEKAWGKTPFESHSERRVKGEVLVVVYDGLAPYKESVKSAATVYENAAEKKNPQVISVAFPKFRKRGYVLSGASITDGNKTADGFIAEDVAEIAYASLEDKNALIAAKTIARAAAKYFAAKKIQESSGGNAFINLATNIFNYASEQADTRSWRTLPGRFIVARLALKPGKHTITVNTTSAAGAARPAVTFEVNLKPGSKKVLPVFAFN